MAKRYAEVMRTGPAPPAETRPMLRPSTAERRAVSLPHLASNIRHGEQQLQMKPTYNVASGVSSFLSASVPLAVVASSDQSEALVALDKAEHSMLSVCAPPGASSRLSIMPPLRSVVSASAPSQLSIASD